MGSLLHNDSLTGGVLDRKVGFRRSVSDMGSTHGFAGLRRVSPALFLIASP